MSKKKQHPRQPGQQPQPNWQPIEMATIAANVDGMLAADKEVHTDLLKAKPNPWVLDDDTVQEVIASFSSRRDEFWLYDEQLKRWLEVPLTDSQRAEVTRLQEQMKLLKENNAKVLELAEELAKGTIEKQLAKSDVELGLDMLMRMFDL